ncbi:choline BCCT transporter BetT [Parvibaculum sp.]|jgi:choline/glycine/proline betaine transport protein|uniref:choline BCCT transporter BetT n=1 Tax=Parvibaculum sp. TaxID=2024848 RepID=UPI000C594FDE|nr:choline BCCT transporter BetT [Parvibaculum sp.]MAM94053.1 high-affinity choline transporter BetT [Parvibaculum sp.]HCX66319.1 high-affinity choline transporter BetT [Rhodobiaceae bacterium]|tara:strand:- start:15838 stop:17901 length:2064 start_codon:yes stop_codon:yes gene_type:complete
MSESTEPDREQTSGDRINPVVFYISAIGIAGFALWTMFFIDSANLVINTTLAWISNSLGWFYFVAVVLYLVFVIAVAFSRFGNLRLGPDHAKPEFNVITWAAMLFAAGIGIDLLFFCVSEPVTQFLAPPVGEGSTVEAARHAMQLTFLHWGISGWGVYTLVGMALAFFSYRHGLPLTIRSALFPIFGRRIYGPIGHSVDIAAVLGTVFGIATSLGIGIIQLNYGLDHVFGIPQSTWTQAGLVVAIIIFAALSAATGVERGIRRLSEFNMALALVLLIFVLFAGETTFLLNAFVMNVGDYVSDFVSMSFNTYAFDPPTDWLNGWTVFFWAWWIAWGPFVGLFLARISRGRTIRQFVLGTLTLPLVFMMAWMSIMGNSAIEMVMAGQQAFGEQAMNNPGSAIYLFLQNMPFAVITTIVVTILGIVFFITSGDSGSLVLSNFTSTLKDVNSDAPVWMRILWAGIIGILTLALLIAGGLSALQSTVVIMGLPFSIVLLLMMGGLYKALRVEGLKEDSRRASLSGYLSGRLGGAPHAAPSWRQRIARATSFPSLKQVHRFMAEEVKPAMLEIKETLAKNGFPATVTEDDEHMEISVDMGEAQNFVYQVWPVRCTMPSFVMRPQQTASDYYRVEPYLSEGSLEYDLMGYTKEQMIDDILDQFERHMHFLHTQREAFGSAVSMPDASNSNPSGK